MFKRYSYYNGSIQNVFLLQLIIWFFEWNVLGQSHWNQTVLVLVLDISIVNIGRESLILTDELSDKLSHCWQEVG